MRYRKEIDGLRALAVLPVILFHAGIETFRGGFVGVDVFFVISGYLITGIILAELNQGKFSLVNFYERRARRILPALFLVLLVCLPFAWVWLLPADMRDFSQSLVAVSVFSSNILFWRESGYFDTATELKPLLHTWSLAVEEQYYVLFPLCLMLIWGRLGRRRVFVVLAVAAIASFALAQAMCKTKPSAAFYLLPTRAWELLMGALISLHQATNGSASLQRRLAPESASLLGLSLLLFPLFLYSKATPYPSYFTLAPTVGTALIILFTTEQTFVGRLLSNKLLVGLGLVSYSAYLWHQPIFAFANYRSNHSIPSLLVYGLIGLSLILAYLSWRYVEKPFRYGSVAKSKKIFSFAGLGALLFIVIGATGHYTNGYALRMSPEVAALSKPLDGSMPGCNWDTSTGPCRLGFPSATPSIAVVGDSHTNVLRRSFSDEFMKSKLPGLSYGQGWCAPLIDVGTSSPQKILAADR